jgi:FtsP/CotA-like multicopper oxidase with cupredoxin domain
MTLIDPADTSAPRSYTLRGVALLATAGMVAAASLLAIPGSAQAATAAASHPSLMVPAAAAGKLAPQGCTATTVGTVTTDSCDLYAMEGTTQLGLGINPPINMWGFSNTGAAGSATAPGPLLVVNQGDTVSVTLHNQIAGQQVSLTFPGQPTTAFTAGSLSAVVEETGIASTDPAKTYTFTASRAGTFIYEAGHTPNGTRQVAMGLAGALVVRSSDGSAYGPPATGYPTTAYDDDAVVVLSEIDPAFNACPISCSAYPLGFDMRSFAPKYRLINGKPFPATDPISTDQSHVVLLRYVNVGSESHSMSLLGDDQTQVAQDGHAMKYAEAEVSMAVEPGATADTLVAMPSGPEAKVALYEAAGRLDNNGQTTADPLSFWQMSRSQLTSATPQPAIRT